MWYWLLLLASFVFAIDDVFTDIPSQFDGFNYSISTGMNAQVGLVKLADVIMRGTTDPRLDFSIFHQAEHNLVVSGKGIVISVGGNQHVLYDTTDSSGTLTVESPWGIAIVYRKGFLFNPSTMFAMKIGIGGEKNIYRYEKVESSEEDHTYVLGGVDIVIGVLTKWGIEMGLEGRALEAKTVTVNDANLYKYTAPQRVFAGRIGVVYHHEQDFE